MGEEKRDRCGKLNFYSPDYIKKGIQGKGSGVLVRVLQRNKTNTVCLCVCVGGEGGEGKDGEVGTDLF